MESILYKKTASDLDEINGSIIANKPAHKPQKNTAKAKNILILSFGLRNQMKNAHAILQTAIINKMKYFNGISVMFAST